MESEQIVRRVIDQRNALDSDRQHLHSLWDELGQICFPRNGTISHYMNPTNQGKADRKRVAENFDGTAMRACNTLATGQAARITPMGARWFVLRPPTSLSDNEKVQQWFARCTEILTIKLGASNFYNRAFECYQYRGAYGISAMEVTAGAKGRGLHFRTLPIGGYSIAENSLDEVDTIYRTYYRSPAQLVEQFGEGLPEKLINLYNDVSTRHKQSEEIIHGLYPRTQRDPRKMDVMNKAMASCHVHVESESLLLESGFDSNPIAVSRWQTNSMNPYGWAPADYALPEAIQANFMEQMLDVLAETSAFPRVLYPAGMKDEIDFGAMGLTSFDPQAGENSMPKEWLTGGRYDVGERRSADKKRAIEQAFFSDLFNSVSRLNEQASATQVNAVVSESREMFHPIYSNMVREFHTPVLRRCFAMLLEQGEMPPPPKEVLEQDTLGVYISDPEVEYVSSMAMALEQTHLSSFNEVMSILMPLAQVDATFLRFLNPNNIGAYLVRSKGLPSSFIRTEEELAEIEAAEAEAAEMQQQQQMLAEAAKGVKNLGGISEVEKLLPE